MSPSGEAIELPFHPLREIDDRALPQEEDAESGAPQGPDLGRVAAAIVGELGGPERPVAGREPGATAARVVVPEAAHDEDRPARPLVREIR